MAPQLLNLDHCVRFTPTSGGALAITSAGNGVDYDVRITDRKSGEDAAVRIEGDGLLDLLELVGSIISTVIQCGDPSERDMIDLSELEQGEELYAVYSDEDEDEQDPTPEGLVIEAIEQTSGPDSNVLVALSELPQLQMQITMLLMSGLGR